MANVSQLLRRQSSREILKRQSSQDVEERLEMREFVPHYREHYRGHSKSLGTHDLRSHLESVREVRKRVGFKAKEREEVRTKLDMKFVEK